MPLNVTEEKKEEGNPAEPEGPAGRFWRCENPLRITKVVSL
jgi:hypothetical protein